MNLTSQQKMIIAEGLANNGRVTAMHAQKTCGGTETGRKALQQLEAMGYIIQTYAIGIFSLVPENLGNLPYDIFEMKKQLINVRKVKERIAEEKIEKEENVINTILGVKR